MLEPSLVSRAMHFVRQYLFHLAVTIAILSTLLLHTNGYARIELIDQIENYLYDLRLRATLSPAKDHRIVILDIDERSLEAEGQWPWHRNRLADLVNLLFDDYRIRGLGFDVNFPEHEEVSGLKLIEELRGDPDVGAGLATRLDDMHHNWDNDLRFAESLIARDVVLGFTFKQYVPANESESTGSLPPPLIAAEQLEGIDIPFHKARGFVGNVAEFQEAAERGAFFSNPQSENVLRKIPLLQSYKGDIYESLGLALARLALGYPDIQFEFAPGEEYTAINLEAIRVGEASIPVDESAAIYIPFRGKHRTFTHVSVIDVLNMDVAPETLRGKLVILGTSAAGLFDLQSTPTAESFAGVEIHATVASAILDGRIKQSPAYVTGIEVVQFCINILILALVMPVASPLWVGLSLVILLVVNVGFNLYMWQVADVILPLASTLIVIIGMSLIQITYDYAIQSRNRSRLSRIFGQYVPSELVEEMNYSGDELGIEGETRNMSVLFSDVRGFTSISEGLAATEVSQMMNRFLTSTTQVIHENRGTIDKYMGDAVMAFWGAPLRDKEHSQHAVISALAIVKAIEALGPDFIARGWPKIRVGIGVASGDMNVGNMGSEFRMAYTVIGDTVNLGSRLEALTKVYGAGVIISEVTALGINGVTLRELDRVRVLGKQESIKIYEPLGLDDEVGFTQRDRLRIYHQALYDYRSQRWEQALELFTELQALDAQRLYELYIQRILSYRDNPPEKHWDGVFTHTSK